MHTDCVVAMPQTSFGNYANLDITHNAENQSLEFSMNVKPRPCFTWDLVRDILSFQDTVRSIWHDLGIRYLVYGSSSKAAFSFGGDLHLFRELIRTRDANKLKEYATDCAAILYNNSISLDCPLTTISLIQGDALGGGFEAALSSNVVIAERSAKLGFPEIMFNLVPGHGAFNLIARRIGAIAASKMILSGRLYPAEELHQMGLIDILVEDGQGQNTVTAYIHRHNKTWNGRRAMQRIQATFMPLTMQELQESADIWVEAALQVGPTHLRVMDRLIRAQDRAVQGQSENSPNLEVVANLV